MSGARAHSLRFRFAVASLLWVGIGTLVAGLVISGLYRRHVTHTFVSDLANHLDELASLTVKGADGRPAIDRPLSDPRFQEKRSGFYWQIERDGRPALISASLAGHHLVPSRGDDTDLPIWTRDHGEWLLRIDRPGPAGLLFSITASGRVLDAELQAFRTDLAVSLGVFATLMLVGAALQVQYGLRPTQRLAEWIEDLRRGRRDRLPDDVPSEFAGVVQQMNELIKAQAALVARARIEAGNLGHNLRTPLALVTGEAEQLADAGHDASAAFILDQCHRMQRQIDYQMKRAAAAGARGTGIVADLRDFIGPIADALRRLHAARDVAIANDIPAGLSVACDPGDLAEILSNLIDNACKWAGSTVRIGAAAHAEGIAISVADDGPGIPHSERVRVLEVGVRLDETTPGTGLGLTISRDIAALYGGTLDLRTAPDAQGLVVMVRLPRR
ncbi:HAMP domain-containing histidine kinase [Sphingomonas sp. AP4-R1]|uniref:sensor histidine kinase n=1 Tax=Sphingomonas sp. AP4-R1 TaxID=2735134 RepID=UPI001493B45C|nr:HAMP domain-containing sensor histidine kinase [Sphingomonas sp. AP4-R1]QJU59848.1 HAMP domain-containing histidine kinase [Sphingomonas sp. AP4-R1]